MGTLKNLAGEETTIIKLGPDTKTTVSTILEKLGSKFGVDFLNHIVDPNLKTARTRALILKNKVEISGLKDLDTEVNDGDNIVMIPITHGG